jgi:hypothetical protein
MLAATFAAVFVALYVGHSVGDHWVQSQCQADTKGQHDENEGQSSRAGRWACTRHVIGLTATKAVLLVLVVLALDVELTAAGTLLGLGIDAGTHWWADRRTTLARLAQLCGKSVFYSLGTGAHPAHPVTGEGKPAASLGTGAYALDQSFHILFLFVAALLIAAV